MTKGNKVCTTIVLVFCAANSAAQNAWIESSTDQTHGSCFPSDTMRVRIFDPYGYDAFDSILISHCADHLFYVDSGLLLFDTTMQCEYPSCGYEVKLVTLYGFQMQGKNVALQNPNYVFAEFTDFTDWKAQWYHDSPKFDLQYELVRCQNEPFFVNIFMEEKNGDSIHFELYDLDGSLPIPEGIKMNPRTGEMSWTDNPDLGLYHFMVNFEEYRFIKNVNLGAHSPRFSIRVTDGCESFIANDQLGSENLFQVAGREFTLNEGETWNRTFRVALEDWDSISVVPSSEMFLHHDIFDAEWSAKTVGDSVEVSIIWNIGNIFGRNHPYLVTYHVSAWKNGKKSDRVLTNAVYVKKVLGLGEVSYEISKLSLYPNPNNGNFTLEYSGTEAIQLMVFDMTGRMVYSFKVVQGRNEVSLSKLESGVYFIQKASGGQIEKLVKQ